MMNNTRYYNLADDLIRYPDAWCYVVYSKRGTGKTYGALKLALDSGLKFVYMKRTNRDVDLICTSLEGMDLSPFAPINRDHNTNIKPAIIKEGLGAFYHCSMDGDPVGDPIGYILSMNAIQKFKGFDMSDCEWIIFDEFIPQLGERLNRSEGDLLMDFYMTVSRDREARGRDSLKLILFANAVNISTPITNTLEIVDDMAEMEAHLHRSGLDEGCIYINTRKIFIHKLSNSLGSDEKKKTGIQLAMEGTNWGNMAFEGSFSYNDFSNVQLVSLKGMKPFIHLHYKAHNYYIYLREYDGLYYMCSSKQKCVFDYDLNLENDQKLFYTEHCLMLRNTCIEGLMKFQMYSMYDLIVNYKSFFKI